METFQQPAFTCSTPTKDYDPKQVPIDGEQYLQSVIYERKNCPAVVVRPIQKINTTESKEAPSIETKMGSSVWEQFASQNEVNFD